MFSREVSRGAVFHADSKRRREVEFTAELRAMTEAAIGELRRMMESGEVPAAVMKPQCDGCSLRGICLPEMAGVRAEKLFEVSS
jgi:CRISPR-associated exonuclease Cas4